MRRTEPIGNPRAEIRIAAVSFIALKLKQLAAGAVTIREYGREANFDLLDFAVGG
jgi:hypothetical protein